MSSISTPDVVFKLIAEDLSLDFCNTIDFHPSENGYSEENDDFSDYSKLVWWGKQAGLISPEVAETLLLDAQKHTTEAEGVLVRARKLRTAIFNLVATAMEGKESAPEFLQTLNRELSLGMAHSQLIAEKGKYSWGWEQATSALDQMLWPIARAATELLISDNRDKIKFCSGETCRWLFLDLSRNHSRQWCDMRDCGNRAKARRHYHRKRKGE